MNIVNLQSSIKSFENKVSSLEGKMNLLEEQYIALQDKHTSLKEKQVIISQAIELLNIIQTANKEIIKGMFENVVTKALNFINQSTDYKFELEFGQRGNLPELRFNLKSPSMQESHDIVDCNSGGDKDIVALALRYVLLEASKTPGFLFLDEIEKRLDSPETEEKMIEFIKELQKETSRQVFMITHSQRMVDAVTNPIILEKTPNNVKMILDGDSNYLHTPNPVDWALDNKEVTTNASETPKRKGRPKGSKNKESVVEA